MSSSPKGGGKHGIENVCYICVSFFLYFKSLYASDVLYTHYCYNIEKIILKRLLYHVYREA